MNALSKAFREAREFSEDSGSYSLLPFRFNLLSDGRYFASNEVGEYLILERHDLEDFVTKRLNSESVLYQDLKAKHFLFDANSDVAVDLLALKYRTRQSHLSRFTSLHLFVVSLRCDYSCPYCQVSRQTTDTQSFDMSVETAQKAVEAVFMSPSRQVKIEFQGGEPLLNFPLIKTIVGLAEEKNKAEKRDLGFVIATNLSHIDEEKLQYCFEHDISISTSLDGPEQLHNKNRPREGKNGYSLTARGIELVKKRLGPSKISALMTTTEASLGQVEAIIDEYLAFGFRGIFLRPLSPYGFAIKTRQIEKYDMHRWLDFYKDGLDYILKLNKQGIPFIEYYSSLLLKKLLTHSPTAYVDLQSPAGAGISALVYNYDGDVYASDESRMLAEMGDQSFRLGNLHDDSYEEMLTSEKLLGPLENSIAESSPMCSECAFLPYCGSDPVYHHATQGEPVGHKAFSGFCARSMGTLEHLIGVLEKGGEEAAILRRWASA